MDAVELQLHTFLTSAPGTVERTIAKHMEAIEVQFYTFLISTPDNVKRSNAQRLDQ